MGPKTNRLSVLRGVGKKQSTGNISNGGTNTTSPSAVSVSASSIATGSVTAASMTTPATAATSIVNGVSHVEGSESCTDDHVDDLGGDMHGMMSSTTTLSDSNNNISRTNSTVDDNDAALEALEALERLRAVDDFDDFIGHHPALKTMCVVDCDSNTRIIPNGPPAILDNECFVGKVMLLVRTPDVDDLENADHHHETSAACGGGVASKLPHFKLNHSQSSSNSNSHLQPGTTTRGETETSGTTLQLSETPARISQYFKHKKRRFEFQFQVKLKRIPTGPLFLGCELEHSIRVGTITKGLVGILLAMVRRINPGFHYSWGTHPHPPTADHHHHHGGRTSADVSAAGGQYEKTHLSFPVEASMDRIVITKPGEALPELGHELDESVESVKRRRKMGSGSVDWNLNDTYTMCLWSAYCDWIQWKSLNVPGMSPFSLSRVTGMQPIYLSVYEISNISPAEYRKKRGATPHTRQHLRVYTRLEFSNDERTIGGIAEQLLGKSTQAKLLLGSSSHGGHGHGGVHGDAASLPDTESVHSDFETKSRVTVL